MFGVCGRLFRSGRAVAAGRLQRAY